MKTLIGLFLSLFIFSSTANAFLYLDPYVGYNKYTLKLETTGSGTYADLQNSSSSASGSDALLGFRAGLSFFGLAIGVDVSKLKDSNRWAILAAFKFPVIPLRILARRFNDSGIGMGDDTEESGFGVGLSYTGMGWLAINFDFNSLNEKFTTYIGDDTYTHYDYTQTELILSLSVPFDI